MSTFTDDETRLMEIDYAKEKGIVCPFCGGGAIQTTQLIQLTVVGCDLEVECLDCDKKYWENYKLIGYKEK